MFVTRYRESEIFSELFWPQPSESCAGFQWKNSFLYTSQQADFGEWYSHWTEQIQGIAFLKVIKEFPLKHWASKQYNLAVNSALYLG